MHQGLNDNFFYSICPGLSPTSVTTSSHCCYVGCMTVLGNSETVSLVSILALGLTG